MLDWFSQCTRTIESIWELQKTVVDEIVDQADRTSDAQKSAIDTAAECGSSLYEGETQSLPEVVKLQVEYWQKQLQLCEMLVKKLIDQDAPPVIRPAVGDRRFIDDSWSENALFDFIKQAYLLSSEHMLSTVDSLEELDPRRQKRLRYFVRQAASALAPTNFVLTNPEVLKKTIESKGENLLKGLQMMVEDKQKSEDMFPVCMSEPDAFELGKDIANTPGHVVYQNRLMQLIQYVPTTAQVNKTPVLLIPSWVNKYYILDLTPKNSLAKWLVDQGHTVFMISWINPDSSYRDVALDDYMLLGPLAAADAIEKITGERQLSGMGYCLGGVLLACTMAYGESRNDKRFVSATYVATTIDYSDTGEIGLILDEHLVASIEKRMSRTGYLDGRVLAALFNFLRENELFWNYYVLNYLKGERPAALDLMHWNGDNTNVPEPTLRQLLNEFYLRNQLVEPSDFTLNGELIDIRRVTTPTYVLAAEKDHIALWQSCYPATQRQAGEVRFVLAGSGHIAGCMNPPSANKYYYYLNTGRPADPLEWLDGAFKVEGSWWSDWDLWLQQYAGEAVPARAVDVASAIESAPGSYVRRRLDSASPHM